MKKPVKIKLSNGVIFEPDKIRSDVMPERAKKVCEMLKERVFVIEDVLEYDPDGIEVSTYDKFFTTMVETLHLGFRHYEFRYHPTMFKFTNDPNEDVKSVGFRTFVGNLAFWYPMVRLRNQIPENVWGFKDCHIITDEMGPQVRASFIEKYINENYVIPFSPHIPPPQRPLSRAIGLMMFKIQTICVHFEKAINLGISIDDFMRLAKKYPRYNEILHTQLDPNLQPAQIEQEMQRLHDEQYEIIQNDDEFTSMKEIILGAKKDQMCELQCVIGLKADNDGNVIPYPINTNFITDGLNTVMQLYINDITGRKAAIVNDEHMGSTGYAWIQVAKVAASIHISPTCKDCRTSNLIPLEIKNTKYIPKLIGRKYRIGSSREWKTITHGDHSDLIGKRIWMRSPTTCACDDGICWECYGDMVRGNVEFNSVGIYAAMMVMNKCMQDVLSVKHSQKTVSEMITIDNPNFNKFFQIASTDIVLNLSLEDPELYSIVVYQDDIQNNALEEDELRKMFDRKTSNSSSSRRSEDDEPEEGAMSLNYYTKRFLVVKNLKAKKIKEREEKEVYEFRDTGDKDFFMHDDMVGKMSFGKDEKGNYIYINLASVDSSEFIFATGVNSQEQTGPIKAVKNLIDNGSHDGCSTIEEMIQRMTDILIDYKIPATLLQGEIIMVNLIRDAKNVLKRPNWRQIVTQNDYRILTITTALKKNPSVTTSLGSSYLRYQFVSDPSTFDKTEPSDYDYPFMPYMDEEASGVPLADVYEEHRRLFEHDESMQGV